MPEVHPAPAGRAAFAVAAAVVLSLVAVPPGSASGPLATGVDPGTTVAAEVVSAVRGPLGATDERRSDDRLPAIPRAVSGPAPTSAPGSTRPATDTVAAAVRGPAGRSARPTLAELADTVPLAQRREAAARERRRERAQVRRQARRLEADRQVALAAMWQPDPTLLSPRDSDSTQTAAVRSRLAGLVARLGSTSNAYEEALFTADRARVDARRAAVVLEAAAERADIARQRWAEDRVALAALAADTYRNGSVGPLSIVLGADAPERLDDRPGETGGSGAIRAGDSDDALFSGLTLLAQVSSTQGDATARAAASARELEDAEDAQLEAQRRAARTAARRADELAAAAQVRQQVVVDVRRAQQLIRDSILVDEIATAVGADELTEVSARAAADLEGGVVFPLPVDSGWRDNDNWGNEGGRWRQGHTGDDFSVACGTPVYAAHEGTVQIRTDQGWSGKWLVTVQAADGGLSTWYAHMMGLTTQHGARVAAGDPIGYVGSLGNSTGCHLHFEVHPLGGSIYEDNVDPVAWLRIARGYPVG